MDAIVSPPSEEWNCFFFDTETSSQNSARQVNRTKAPSGDVPSGKAA
jgi:hypothetical protein